MSSKLSPTIAKSLDNIYYFKCPNKVGYGCPSCKMDGYNCHKRFKYKKAAENSLDRFKKLKEK